MRYNNVLKMNLNEATIQVPSAIKKPVLKIVGSVLLSMLKRQENMYKTQHPGKGEYQLEQLQRAMGVVQQRCPGSAPLSEQELKRVTTGSLDLNLDVDAIMDEMRHSIKDINQINAVYENLSSKKVTLTVYEQRENTDGYVQPTSGGLVIGIGIRPSMSDPVHTVYDVLSAIDHETQHVTQVLIISVLEGGPGGKHLPRTAPAETGDSTEDFKNYVTSFVEYGPHVGDFVNLFIKTADLLKMRNVIKPEMDTAQFKKYYDLIIKTVLQNSKSLNTFFSTMKERDPDNFKKAWRTVYKQCSEYLTEIKTRDVSYAYTDVPEQDIEENVNVMYSLYSKLNKEPDVKIIGLSSQNVQELEAFRIQYIGVTITIHKKGDVYNVKLDYNGNTDSYDLDVKALFTYVDSFELFVQPGELFSELDIMETMKSGTEVDKGSIKPIIDSAEESLQNQGIKFETVETDTGYRLTIAGVCDFTLAPANSTGSSKYIRIESDKYNYVRYNVSVLQAYSFFLHLAINVRENTDEINEILSTSASYIDAMFKLDEL